MKNGRIVWRNFAVDAEEKELLNRIIGSEEYKKMAYQHYDDGDYEYISKYIEKQKVDEIAFNNGFRVENLNPEEVDTIRELWKKDMENADYSTLREEYKCGVIEMATKQERKNGVYHIYDFSCDVYPSFTNLRGYLEEKGIDTDAYVKAEDIESITVTNFHTEEEMELRKKMKEEYGDSYVEISMKDLSVTKTFTEGEKIEELAEAMYPSYMSRQWKAPGKFRENIM